jgi:hypothetical protein
MRRAFFAVLIVLCFVPAASAQKTRRVYLSVTTPEGAPVTDLTAADVQLREDGVEQKVAKVSLSNHPMRIALLVDTTDSQYQQMDLRAALGAFIDAIPAQHELMFVSTGQNVRVVVQPTLDRKKMKDSAGSVFLVKGGTLLFDGINEIDNRFMKKATDQTPIFVVVSGDGTEASQGFDAKLFEKFAQSLADRHVVVHSIILSRGAVQNPGAIALNLSRITRGRGDVISSSLLLGDKLTALAKDLAEDEAKMSTWYEIDFTTASKNPQPTIDISLTRNLKTTFFAERRLR